jgi:hypothetical protein
MHPREQLLQKAVYLSRLGKPLPVDVLVEAERLGIILSDFCNHTNKPTNHETKETKGYGK